MGARGECGDQHAYHFRVDHAAAGVSALQHIQQFGTHERPKRQQ